MTRQPDATAASIAVAEGVLRTPDDRFRDLPDYPFKPNYVGIEDEAFGKLRMHYLDEGPRDGPVVLCFHGEPSWSYLYRKMIPLLVAGGARVIAPDLIGFGRSDKPSSKSDYSYERMVGWMVQFVDALDISDASLFCQDWGGLLGLRVLAARPERFARVTISNTALPEGRPETIPSEFRGWRMFSIISPVFPIHKIVQKASETELTPAEQAAYLAPFPTRKHKASARVLPRLVPIKPDMPSAAENRAAWAELAKFDKPFLTLFGDQDPITSGWEQDFIDRIPGAKGEPHAIIKGAGHFSQEDAPEELAAAVLDQIARHPA